ncbi:hypothetical protein [Ralstonia syzygii]|nr:hypothetical protein [Ralstonia syzygii]
MKTSMDFFNEYVEAHSPHGQKAVAELLGTSQAQVTMWKKAGRLSAAATVKLGVELGYDVDLCTHVALMEAEKTESGKKTLAELFARRAGGGALAVMIAIATAGMAASDKSVARPAGIEPATPAFGGQSSMHCGLAALTLT